MNKPVEIRANLRVYVCNVFGMSYKTKENFRRIQKELQFRLWYGIFRTSYTISTLYQQNSFLVEKLPIQVKAMLENQ